MSKAESTYCSLRVIVFDNIVTGNDGLDVLRNSRVGSCSQVEDIATWQLDTHSAIIVPEEDQVRLNEQIRLRRLCLSEFTDRGKKFLSFLYIGYVIIRPLVVRADEKIVLFKKTVKPDRGGVKESDRCSKEAVLLRRTLPSHTLCRPWLPTFGIFGATCKEAPSDELVDTIVVASQVARMGGRMYR